MNDEINRINEQNRKFDSRVSPGDQSHAKDSKITTPDEDERKRKMAEGIIAELSNHTQEIDSIKQALNVISQQLNQITAHLNQGATPQNPADPNAKGLNMEALGQLGDLVEKGISAYKSLKGSPPTTQSFLDHDYINEQVKKSVMGNFEIGDALVSNLKSKLINKAVASSVSDAMNDNSHDPQ